MLLCGRHGSCDRGGGLCGLLRLHRGSGLLLRHHRSGGGFLLRGRGWFLLRGRGGGSFLGDGGGGLELDFRLGSIHHRPHGLGRGPGLDQRGGRLLSLHRRFLGSRWLDLHRVMVGLRLLILVVLSVVGLRLHIVVGLGFRHLGFRLRFSLGTRHLRSFWGCRINSGRGLSIVLGDSRRILSHLSVLRHSKRFFWFGRRGFRGRWFRHGKRHARFGRRGLRGMRHELRGLRHWFLVRLLNRCSHYRGSHVGGEGHVNQASNDRSF